MLAPPPWLQACEPPYYTRHVSLHTAACWIHHHGFKPVSHHTTQGMCHYTQQNAGSTTLASSLWATILHVSFITHSSMLDPPPWLQACEPPYYTRHVSVHTAACRVHHLGFKPVSYKKKKVHLYSRTWEEGCGEALWVILQPIKLYSIIIWLVREVTPHRGVGVKTWALPCIPIYIRLCSDTLVSTQKISHIWLKNMVVLEQEKMPWIC